MLWCGILITQNRKTTTNSVWHPKIKMEIQKILCFEESILCWTTTKAKQKQTAIPTTTTTTNKKNNKRKTTYYTLIFQLKEIMNALNYKMSPWCFMHSVFLTLWRPSLGSFSESEIPDWELCYKRSYYSEEIICSSVDVSLQILSSTKYRRYTGNQLK